MVVRSRARRLATVMAVLAALAAVLAACGEPDPAPPPPPTTAPAQPTCVRPASVQGGAAAAPDPAPDAAPADGESYFAVTEGPGGQRRVVRFRAAGVADRQRNVDSIEHRGDRVLVVEPDSVVQATAIADPVYVGLPSYGPSGQYGLGNAHFPDAWVTLPGQAAGIRVAVVDTGVQGDHPDFAGGAVVAGTDFVCSTDGRTDPNSHGTHVAGIIAARINGVGGVGGAPQATVVPVRVLGANGSGSMSDVISGIYWAADPTRGDAAVINLSLGGSPSTALQAAVQYAVDQGVVVVAAAGNDGLSSGSLYPGGYASIEGVLAVASTDASNNRSSFSTVAAYDSISAPGSGIWSTIPTSTWGLKSGTSMATPFVAAAAALVKAACPAYSPAQVETRLESTAQDLGTPGPDTSFGAGLVRPDLAVAAAC